MAEKKLTLSEHSKNYFAEYKKIIWPNKTELSKLTLTVIVTSLFIGSIIAVMDVIYTVGYNLLLSIF